MNLAQKCSRSFTLPTRLKGQAYFSAGMVQDLQILDDSITARVRGSQADDYQVDLDISDPDARNITATCTCPRFAEGFLCKHIWAVLLAHDQHDEAVDTAQPSVTVEHVDSPTGRGQHSPQSRYQLNQHELQKLGSFMLPSSSKPKKKRVANWKKQLEEIAEHQGGESRPEWDRPQSTTRPREIFYVLNVGASQTKKHLLAIEFFQREQKKNGQWGKFKRLAIHTNQLDLLPTDEDRELISALIGNEPDEHADSGYGYSYGSVYYTYRGYNRSWVRPSMFEWILPKLTATGRFVWALDTSLPIEDASPLEWDSGPPWRCQFGLETDKDLRCWRVTGAFVRDGETRPLAQAALLLLDGLVLFPNRLGLAEFGDSAPWVAALRKGPPIEIPFKDRLLLLDHLCKLPGATALDLPGSVCEHREQGTPQPRIEIGPPSKPYYGRESDLWARVYFVYGDKQFHLRDESTGAFDADGNRLVLRNRERERELAQRVHEFGFTYPNSYYAREEADFTLPEKKLVDAVRGLDAAGWMVETQGIRVRRPGELKFDVVSSVDWFELHGKIDFDGVSATLPALLAALRNNEKFIRLDDGSQGLLPEEWLKKYGNIARLAEASGDTLRFSNSQGLLLDALLAEQENVQIDAGFLEYREKLRNFSGVEAAAPVESFQGTLRHYQQEGLGWLHFLREYRFGGCLADDMGLGKTVQVLALLEARRRREIEPGETRQPSIVVVPKSLVFNWIEEAARFTPQLRVLNFTGIDRGDRHAELHDYDVLITTYGTLRRDVVKLRDIQFDYAILDEAQAIKNAGSQAAKACRLIKARNRLAMSGTPIENHLGELWSLFDFLNPGMLGRSSAFSAMSKASSTDAGSLEVLSRAVRPFLLRRTKEQVLSELPEKLEQTLTCDLAPAERKAYDELRDYYRVQLTNSVKSKGLAKSKIHVLEALLRLRQAACHPGLLDRKKIGATSAKLEALLEQVREVIDEGHKALVFSQFTSLLAIVRHHLDKQNTVYEYLDGQTRDRGAKVKRFQEDPHCPLFLISLKAGGHGLNLTAADYVFILDPWWNPAVEAQAVDRAHRIGQTRRVFAYRLIARGTVEDKILELQKSKKDLADAIVSANNSLIQSLTAEDLELLLS